jgi:hypothetical protein
MQFAVQASPKRKKYLESLLPSMIKQLKLTRSRRYLVVKVDKLDNSNGLTMSIDGLDTYLVVINPANVIQMGLTLAHEMVHVKQMASGKLKGNVWNGKKVSKRTKYLNLPWEIQAFEQQELIFRRAID